MSGGAVDQPLALAADVMELRAYARAKHLIDTTEDESKLPQNNMLDWVRGIEGELLKRRVAGDDGD